MENKDTKAIDDDNYSGHVSKINKEENFVKKINQDICEISKSITKKLFQTDNLDYALRRANELPIEQRHRIESNECLQRGLYTTLDELNLMIKAANGEWYGEEKLDKNSLNYLKLHGSKSLAKEKQIMKDIKIQQKDDVASLKSPSSFFYSNFAFIINKITYNREDKMFWWTVENLEHIRKKYYLNDWQKFMIEIEQLRIQHLERASGNDSVKANISKYESLKKIIQDKIKVLCDDSLRESRKWMEWRSETRGRNGVKEIEAINREIYSLIAKLREKHKKKDLAYERILKLKKLNDQEVGKFMLEWNNNKAFREDHEKMVLRSLERRQQSRDERRRPAKS